MFEKILVAMDSSTMSRIVFEQALHLAQKNQASLMLLHVLSGEDENSPLPIPPNLERMYWAPGTEIDIDSWRQQWKTYESECLEQLRAFAAEATTTGAGLKQKLSPNEPQTCFISYEYVTILVKPFDKTIRNGCTKSL